VVPRQFVVAFLAAVIASVAGSAQDDPVFSVRSELVVLQVRVEDRRGVAVAGLGREAFTVTEDWRPQPIEFFEAQDAPATIGLIVDDSGSIRPVRDRVIAAAGAFVETSHPDDEVFALTFNNEVRPALPLEVRFTGNAEILRDGLRRTMVAWGRSSFHDAVIEGLDRVTHGRHTRRVLVVVADGGDNASTASIEDVLRQVESSQTLVYAIVVVDPADLESNPRRLEQIARASGGEAFKPRGAQDIEDAFAHIAREIRALYTVGYSPPSDRRGGGFRRIRVTATAPGGARLHVRTRPGYRVENGSR
jgi:Ca-activated chloride channel homolog